MEPNKTFDLCERCEYCMGRKCNPGNCGTCPLADYKDGRISCKCGTVPFNTPCPHFKDAEEIKTCQR